MFIALALVSGCSSLKSKDSKEARGIGIFSVIPAEIESFRASEPEPPGMAVPEFDNIPEDVQPHVQKWLNYFQGRGREHMERYLSRSTRYERLMKRILRENGIPEDLIYIALIESGFSPRAISRARAVGYWQFIRGTGTRYGLQINTFVDERRDPVLATQAAADYFKGLYGEFNSWFLAMASYNVGEGRVRREINKNKTRDFWTLAKKRRLPKETLNYVPKYLAARIIGKNPEAYGFTDIPYEPPIEFETVAFNQAINMKVLAEKMNVDYAEIKRLNPKYRGEVAPIDGSNVELRLPLNTKESALAMASEASVKDLVFVPDRGETDVYKVRKGDTLLKIAKRFKTSVANLREINDFKRKSRLKPGRTIFVPIPAVAMPKPVNKPVVVAQNKPAATVDDSKAAKSADEALYIMQEGESLAEVASKNNMTMEELMELNSFSEGQVVAVGMQIRVKKIGPEADEPSIDELPSSTEVVAGDSKETKAAPAPEPVVTADSAQTVAVSEPKSEATQVEPNNSEYKETVEEPVAKLSKRGAKKETISRLRSAARKELTHKVKPGETLYRIALRYKTTVDAIKKMNKMKSEKGLRAGSILKIPSASEKRTTRSIKREHSFVA
jgi:membrane-bound lytic murein transglycosylase D